MFRTLVTAISTMVLLTGCLVSPLFDHVDAEDLKRAGEKSITGCAFRFEAQKLCASMEWVKEPTEEETGELILRFWDPDRSDSERKPQRDPPAEVSEVSMKLWMPSMNHGSEPPIRVTRESEGVYRATQVFFIMHGDWEIWVQLGNGTQIVGQAKVDVRI